MSSDEKSASSPTKPDGSPQNTIRVIKTNDSDQTVVEVKVAGEDGAKVTVFGGDGLLTNGIAEKDKTDEKQSNVNDKPDSNDKDIESSKEVIESEAEKAEKAEITETKNDEKENEENDANNDKEILEPLTKEEIEKIVSKYRNKFNKNDLEKYLEFFWSVDQYSFGVFTFFQLVYRLRKMRRLFSTREVAEMFADIDHDNDRLVSLDEFLDEMSREKPRPKTEEEWRATFDYCDKNQDGFVCKEDIAAVLREKDVHCLEADILLFLHRNKAGADMKLDFREFRWAVKH